MLWCNRCASTSSIRLQSLHHSHEKTKALQSPSILPSSETFWRFCTIPVQPPCFPTRVSEQSAVSRKCVMLSWWCQSQNACLVWKVKQEARHAFSKTVHQLQLHRVIMQNKHRWRHEFETRLYNEDLGVWRRKLFDAAARDNDESRINEEYMRQVNHKMVDTQTKPQYGASKCE